MAPLIINEKVWLQVGAGLALIHHGGHGESLLERQMDLGATGTLGAHVAITRRLELGLDAAGYLYRSKLAPAEMPNGELRPARRADRADVLITPALRFVF